MGLVVRIEEIRFNNSKSDRTQNDFGERCIPDIIVIIIKTLDFNLNRS